MDVVPLNESDARHVPPQAADRLADLGAPFHRNILSYKGTSDFAWPIKDSHQEIIEGIAAFCACYGNRYAEEHKPDYPTQVDFSAISAAEQQIAQDRRERDEAGGGFQGASASQDFSLVEYEYAIDQAWKIFRSLRYTPTYRGSTHQQARTAYRHKADEALIMAIYHHQKLEGEVAPLHLPTIRAQVEGREMDELQRWPEMTQRITAWLRDRFSVARDELEVDRALSALSYRHVPREEEGVPGAQREITLSDQENKIKKLIALYGQARHLLRGYTVINRAKSGEPLESEEVLLHHPSEIRDRVVAVVKCYTKEAAAINLDLEEARYFSKIARASLTRKILEQQLTSLMIKLSAELEALQSLVDDEAAVQPNVAAPEDDGAAAVAALNVVAPADVELSIVSVQNRRQAIVDKYVEMIKLVTKAVAVESALHKHCREQLQKINKQLSVARPDELEAREPEAPAPNGLFGLINLLHQNANFLISEIEKAEQECRVAMEQGQSYNVVAPLQKNLEKMRADYKKITASLKNIYLLMCVQMAEKKYLELRGNQPVSIAERCAGLLRARTDYDIAGESNCMARRDLCLAEAKAISSFVFTLLPNLAKRESEQAEQSLELHQQVDSNEYNRLDIGRMIENLQQIAIDFRNYVAAKHEEIGRHSSKTVIGQCVQFLRDISAALNLLCELFCLFPEFYTISSEFQLQIATKELGEILKDLDERGVLSMLYECCVEGEESARLDVPLASIIVTLAIIGSINNDKIVYDAASVIRYLQKMGILGDTMARMEGCMETTNCMESLLLLTTTSGALGFYVTHPDARQILFASLGLGVCGTTNASWGCLALSAIFVCANLTKCMQWGRTTYYETAPRNLSQVVSTMGVPAQISAQSQRMPRRLSAWQVSHASGTYTINVLEPSLAEDKLSPLLDLDGFLRETEATRENVRRQRAEEVEEADGAPAVLSQRSTLAAADDVLSSPRSAWASHNSHTRAMPSGGGACVDMPDDSMGDGVGASGSGTHEYTAVFAGRSVIYQPVDQVVVKNKKLDTCTLAELKEFIARLAP